MWKSGVYVHDGEQIACISTVIVATHRDACTCFISSLSLVRFSQIFSHFPSFASHSLSFLSHMLHQERREEREEIRENRRECFYFFNFDRRKNGGHSQRRRIQNQWSTFLQIQSLISKNPNRFWSWNFVDMTINSCFMFAGWLIINLRWKVGAFNIGLCASNIASQEERGHLSIILHV